MFPSKVNANTIVSSSANIIFNEVKIYSDERVVTLKNYLESKNSPLADYSFDLIYQADVYNLDWRLIPAISGVESSFGKRIPANSYNSYGWANGKYSFESWEDSIEKVAKALKEKYQDRGKNTVYEISPIYCPPNPAWGNKVKFFMEQIESYPLTYDN